MDTSRYGHTWETAPATMPALVNATRAVWAAPPHVHHVRRNALWVLDYSVSDLGRIRVGSRSRSWQRHAPFEALLYPPATPYWEDMRGCALPLRNSWLLFRTGAATGLARRVPPAVGFARFLDPAGRLGALIDQAVEVGRRLGADGYWQAMAAFCTALDLLLRAPETAPGVYRIPATDVAPPPTLASRAADFLAAHLGERLTLGRLARHLGVSVSSLSHRYRADTGETPIATLIRLRVEQARSLLLKGQPLKTIAPALGFSDVCHLSKTFRRVAGRSPREVVRALSARPPPGHG